MSRAPSESGPWPATVAGILLLLGALALQVAWLGDPLRYELGDLGGALYAGSFARHWDDLGLLVERGCPSLNLVPAVGDPHRMPYLMHPPLAYWSTWLSCEALGWSPLALRLPGFLAFAGGMAALAFAGAILGRGREALGIAVVAAWTPQALLYGSTPHNQPYVLGLALITAFFVVLFRARGGALAGLGLILVAALACFSDWEMAWFAPLLGALALLGGGPRRGRALLLLILGAALGLLLLASWFVAVETEAPDGAGVIGSLQVTLERVWSKKEMMDAAPGSQLLRSAEHVGRLYPASGLFLGLIGFFMSWRDLLRRERSREALFVLLLLLPAVVDCALVPEHAALHPYWTLPGIPAFGALVIRGVVAVARGRLRWFVALTLVVLAESAGRGLWERERVATPLLSAVAEEVDRRLPPHSMLVGYTPALMASRYLTGRPIFIDRISVDRLRYLETWTRTDYLHVVHLYYLVAPGENGPSGTAPTDAPEILAMLEGLPEERFTVPHFEGTVTYRLVRLWPR